MNISPALPDTKTSTADNTLLSIRNLNVTYPTRRGDMNVIADLALDVKHGEVLGLVGESGCGKSTLGKAIMRLIPAPGKTTGHLTFDGTDLLTLDESHMREYRGRRLSMIFQDPMTSLNPIQRLDQHIVEAIRVHEPNVTQGSGRLSGRKNWRASWGSRRGGSTIIRTN